MRRFTFVDANYWTIREDRNLQIWRWVDGSGWEGKSGKPVFLMFPRDYIICKSFIQSNLQTCEFYSWAIFEKQRQCWPAVQREFLISVYYSFNVTWAGGVNTYSYMCVVFVCVVLWFCVYVCMFGWVIVNLNTRKAHVSYVWNLQWTLRLDA